MSLSYGSRCTGCVKSDTFGTLIQCNKCDVKLHTVSGIILWMRPANERRCYIITSSPIGWEHTQNDPCCVIISHCPITILCQRQNGHPLHTAFANLAFNENCCILIQISWRFVHQDLIENKLVLVQQLAWCQTGNELYLKQSWLISLMYICILLTYICVTSPQWVSAKAVTSIKSTARQIYILYMSHRAALQTIISVEGKGYIRCSMYEILV